MSATSNETASRDERPPRVAVVVGPGRSGTSAITRGLAALDIPLGDRLKPGVGRKNAKGFFEDEDLLEVNYRLHEAFGLRRNGSSVHPVSDALWRELDLEPLRDEALRIIDERFAGHDLWGFKCGGVMRLLPFWEDVFARRGIEPVYVVAIRNPLSVAGSRQRLDYFRGLQEKCDLEILAQVVPYFRRVARSPFLVVDYDNLMENPRRELDRMAATLGVTRTETVERGIEAYRSEFLSEDLRRNRTDPEALIAEPRINPLTRDAYDWLHRLACDRVDPDSEALWADWGRIEGQFAAMGPVLRHVDFLEDKLRGRALGLNKLWQTVADRVPLRRNGAGEQRPSREDQQS